MALITKDTKIGEQFTGKPKTYAWERLWAFSGGRFRLEGWPTKNIHTDLPFAQASGLPVVAASATQYEGNMTQLMIDLFGEQWLTCGTSQMKFTALVDADDVLTCKAMVQAKEDLAGGATKFILDISSDNQRGEKAIVGQAQGIVGKADPATTVATFKARVAELKADATLNHNLEAHPLDPLEYVPTPELNQQFCFAQQDYHPRYIEGSEFGPPIVHPGLLLNWSNATRSPTYVRGGVGNEGGVHAQDEAFWHNPAFVGKKLKVTWDPQAIGNYERRDRTWSVSGEILIVDEDGREILRRLSRSTMASSATQPYKKSG